jgi:hypothetical protein
MLETIPFSERGSRLLVFRDACRLDIRLAERWAKWEAEVGDYRHHKCLAMRSDDGMPGLLLRRPSRPSTRPNTIMPDGSCAPGC